MAPKQSTQTTGRSITRRSEESISNTNSQWICLPLTRTDNAVNSTPTFTAMERTVLMLSRTLGKEKFCGSVRQSRTWSELSNVWSNWKLLAFYSFPNGKQRTIGPKSLTTEVICCGLSNERKHGDHSSSKVYKIAGPLYLVEWTLIFLRSVFNSYQTKIE